MFKNFLKRRRQKKLLKNLGFCLFCFKCICVSNIGIGIGKPSRYYTEITEEEKEMPPCLKCRFILFFKKYV